jgi:hypothetical protein
MRGWLSLFTRESGCQRYRTGIVVASAEPDIIRNVLQRVQLEFPGVSFSFLGPRAYERLTENKLRAVWLEDAKVSPLRWLLGTRRQRFDMAVMVWAGQPTFRKAKLAGLLLNPRRWVIYDENADEILVDRAHWRRLVRLIASRWNRHRPGPMLHPLGWIYLFVTTARLARRAGRIVRLPEWK